MRQIHLAYNQSNTVSGGCHDEDKGLSALGRRVVQAIFDCGMLMDLSHMGYQSARRGLRPCPRPCSLLPRQPQSTGRSPAQYSRFADCRLCANRWRDLHQWRGTRFLGIDQLTPKRFAEHAAYVANLVGAAHVGMGIDTFTTQDGIDDMPPELIEDEWWPKAHYATGIGKLSYLQPEDIPAIHAALLHEGFSPEESRGI